MYRRTAARALAVAGALAVSCLAGPAQASTHAPSKSHWLATVRTRMAGGTTYLDRHRHVAHRAIVLDIDNTSLETHYTPGAATPPVLAFERRAVHDGYTVIVITGRLKTGRASSTAQLRHAGYRVDRMCLRDSAATPLGTEKNRCRGYYAKRGFDIVADVGNNATDFAGSHHGKIYRLPNYHGALS